MRRGNNMEELKEALGMVYKILCDTDLAESIAKMYKNIFDAMIKEGFTADQAIRILASLNIGNNK